MKKITLFIAVLALAALSLAGCASGSFLGLATSQSVDAKEKALADQQAATAAEIEQLKAQLADVQSFKDQAATAVQQAQAAVDEVSQTQKVIQDLQALAQKAEDRIGSIPKEVIKQIVDILQASLQQ